MKINVKSKGTQPTCQMPFVLSCEHWKKIVMARPKSNNVQINISVPSEWKTELENLARIYSVEEGKTITFLDLMRRGIKEKYQLGEKDDERGTIS